MADIGEAGQGVGHGLSLLVGGVRVDRSLEAAIQIDLRDVRLPVAEADPPDSRSGEGELGLAALIHCQTG